MKVEIEIPDLESFYFSEYEDDEITVDDFKKAIINNAIEKFIDHMYDDYMQDRVYDTIKNDASALIKENSKEIIDRVVYRVSEEILRKKSIVEEMPKKSEVSNISKEWEQYFIELIDKAIAKRFK